MKKIFSLLVLVALLVGYIAWHEVPSIRQEKIASRVFGDTEASQIQAIQIKNNDQFISLINNNPHRKQKGDPEDLVLDSNDQEFGDLKPLSWNFEDLPKAKLERASVEGITQAIAGLTYTKRIPSSELEGDKSAYGINDKSLTIIAKINDKEHEITLGEKNEFVNARYMSVKGDNALYLIDDTLFDAATLKKEAFRSKLPIAFSDASVEQISVTSGNSKFVIKPENPSPAKSGQEKTFRIIEPLNVSASNFAVFDLYRNLRNLQAEAFLDNPKNLNDFGLEKNFQEITINRNAEDLIIRLGQVGDKVYFTVSENQFDPHAIVYQAVGNPKNSIFKPVDNYRQVQQFNFDPYLADRVTVHMEGNQQLFLENDQGQWQFDDKIKADAPFVREFLKKLSELAAEEFVDTSSPLFKDQSWSKSPYIKVEVSIDESDINGKAQKLVLLVGNLMNNDAYPAIVESIKEPFLLSKDTVKELTPGKEKFMIVNK